MIYRLILMDS